MVSRRHKMRSFCCKAAYRVVSRAWSRPRRFELAETFQLTPSLQWISNTGFDSSDTVLDEDQFIASLRANYTF